MEHCSRYFTLITDSVKNKRILPQLYGRAPLQKFILSHFVAMLQHSLIFRFLRVATRVATTCIIAQKEQNRGYFMADWCIFLAKTGWFWACFCSRRVFCPWFHDYIWGAFKLHGDWYAVTQATRSGAEGCPSISGTFSGPMRTNVRACRTACYRLRKLKKLTAMKQHKLEYTPRL